MPDAREIHDWRADVRARLASAKLDPQDEADVVEEVAQHLEFEFVELSLRVGAHTAREQLLAQLREQSFDEAAARRRRRAPTSRSPVWSSTSLGRDLRYGLRSLMRSPGTTAAGVLALALGIALTTVMYSVIYGLLIKGLPFEDPARIAIIYRTDPTGRGREDLVPFGDYVRYRGAQRSFATFGGYAVGTATISGGDRPERAPMARITASAMDVAGVRAIVGRSFLPSDNVVGAPPTVLLGYAIWRDRFASDSSVIGKQLRVNGRLHTIIGVMPEGNEFPRSAKLWLPFQVDEAGLQVGEGTGVVIVARLKRDTDYDKANAELAGLSRQLSREHADTAALRDAAQPFVRAQIPTRVYSALYVMLTAVFLVLLVACANVANLLLDRAANRTREIGIRLALGASRLAVIRQTLVESSILAAMAAVVGTGLAQAGIVVYNRATIGTDAAPFWMDVRLHWPVLVFVLAVALLSSIVSGLLPAIHSARLDINAILKDESHAASSLRVGKASRAIVIAEIALSSAMLLAAGFITKSMMKLRDVDPKFTTADVYTARVSLLAADSARNRGFFEMLEQNLGAAPGLRGVSLSSELPGSGWDMERVAIDGRTYARPRDYPPTRWIAVTPGFFTTFNVPLLSGRGILPTDRVDAPRVAVVSESFVRRYLRDGEPIGRRIRLGGAESKAEWLTVVGVMPTLYAATITDPWPPEVLTAFWQQPRILAASIALRGSSEVAGASALRKQVEALNADVPVYATTTMAAALAEFSWPLRLLGTMFVIFGVVALLLSAIGLYAVMAFSVSRRTREMGIRMALGATNGHVIRMVCRSGATQMLIGIVLGFALGSAFVRLARQMLFEVRPSDPTVFALVAGVLGVTAFVACIIPAMRATRADPLVALRRE